MLRRAVGADAEDDRAAALELAPRVADAARLAGAAGRVVAGVEVEDDRRSAQRGKGDVFAGVASEGEGRSRFSFRDHAHPLPLARVGAMVSVHVVLGVAVIAVCAAAAALGFAAHRRGAAGRTVAHALALAQTVLIGQAAVGLLLLSDGRRAPDRLHYTYGAIALGVALSPWFYAPAAGSKRLLWFAGTTLLAGALAVRAFMTGS